MLPHVGERPLSVLRIPETIADEQFFQRHLPANGGLHNVDEIEVPVKNRTEHYMAIDTELGLLPFPNGVSLNSTPGSATLIGPPCLIV